MKIMEKTGKNPFRLACVGAVMGLFAAGSANATLYTGASGSLAASADFTISGNLLKIVLTNTTTSDVNNASGVLTGLFFNISGNTSLTASSAFLTAGSTVVYDTQPAAGNVGGEWAYNNNVGNSGPGTGSKGISSASYDGLFGNANFGGVNLANGSAVSGVDYGLLSAGHANANDTSALTGSGGLIRNSVTFTLSGIFGNTIPSFSSVFFQFGNPELEGNGNNSGSFQGNICTSNCANNVPEPSAYLLVFAGFMGLAGYKLKHKKEALEA
jgi:hypothetical protein